MREKVPRRGGPLGRPPGEKVAGQAKKGVYVVIVACPVCRKKCQWEGNPFRPFCSERCKLTDLGAWAGEEYRIAGEKLRDDEDENEK